MPADWHPSEDDTEAARALGLDGGLITLEIYRFRTHWQDEGAERYDWSKEWREWLRGVRGTRQVDNAGGNGRRHTAYVNMRESVMEFWLKKRLITRSEYDAGHRMRELWEITLKEGGKGKDFSQPFASGGGPRTLLSDHQLDASHELGQMKDGIGHWHYVILVKVVAQRHTLKDAASHFGYHSKDTVDLFGQEVRAGLARLVKVCGR